MSFCADDGVQYIEDHLKEVCQAVDDKIEESSDEIEKQIFDYIKKHVKADTKHLEWDFDGCPYDHSGILVEKGTIGGWHYECFEDLLSELTIDIAENILKKITRAFIEKHFGIQLNEDIFDEILDRVHDPIYYDTLVSSFFSSEFVLEWLGIEDITIQEILNMEGLPNVCD